MKQFYLQRNIDVNGVSGTGKVVEGVVLPSGRVVIEWQGKYPSICIYNSIQEFQSVHVDSHPGCSEIIYESN